MASGGIFGGFGGGAPGGILGGLLNNIRQNPEVVSALASGFLNPNGQGTMGAMASAAQNLGPAMATSKKRKAMNALLQTWPNLSPEMRAFYQANPGAFDPAAFGPKDPIEVSKGASLYDPNKDTWTSAPGAASLPDPEPGYEWGPADASGRQTQRPIIGGSADVKNKNTTYDNKTKLRGEYVSASKDYVAIRDAYSKVDAASKDNTGASDIAMVYGFMKMLDPTSVVREGEFATAANAGGIPERVQAIYNNMINGQKLAPEIRRQFMEQSKRQLEAASARHKSTVDQYSQLAKTSGFDPAEIVLDLSGGVVAPPNAGPLPAAPGATAPGAPVPWQTFFGGGG